MVIGDTEEENIFFSRLEERGEASVRADLETAHFGGRSALARKWIYLKDQERYGERDAQAMRSIEAAERSAVASERSAEATELAAKAAMSSARYAMWAAIISLVAIAVTVVSDFYR